MLPPERGGRGRSGTESAAVLDVCKRLGILAVEAHGTAQALADRIASMLTRLAQRRSFPTHPSGGGAGEGEGAGGSRELRDTA